MTIIVYFSALLTFYGFRTDIAEKITGPAYLFEIMRWYKAQTNQLDRLYGQERPDTLDKAPSPYWRGSSKVRWHLERTSLRANLNGLRLAYERTTNGDLRLDEIIKSLYSGDATTREIFNMKDETG